MGTPLLTPTLTTTYRQMTRQGHDRRITRSRIPLVPRGATGAGDLQGGRRRNTTYTPTFSVAFTDRLCNPFALLVTGERGLRDDPVRKAQHKISTDNFIEESLCWAGKHTQRHRFSKLQRCCALSEYIYIYIYICVYILDLKKKQKRSLVLVQTSSVLTPHVCVASTARHRVPKEREKGCRAPAIPREMGRQHA